MKKSFLIFLILVLIFSFVGCSENNNEVKQEKALTKEIKMVENIVSVEEYEFKDEKLKSFSGYNIVFKSENVKAGLYLSYPNDYKDKGYPTIIYFPDVKPSQERSAEKFTVNGAVTITVLSRGYDICEGEKDLGGEDYKDAQFAYNLSQSLSVCNADNVYIAAASEGSIRGFKLAAEYENIKGISTVAGLIDVERVYEEGDESTTEYLESVLGTPDENEEAYESRSAIGFVDQIKCPVYIIESSAVPSWEVNISTAREFISELQLYGIDAQFGGTQQIVTDFDGEALQLFLEWSGIKNSES